MRLPQEDFCQALAVPSWQKYEADGGPGVLQADDLDAGEEPLDRLPLRAEEVGRQGAEVGEDLPGEPLDLAGPLLREREREVPGDEAAAAGVEEPEDEAGLEALLDECDKFPLGELPQSHQGIFNVALSMAEIAPHIEFYRGQPGVPYAFEESRFVAVHGRDETWKALPPNGPR